VHGALLEALNAAAAPAKAELALAALPAAKDGQPQQAGSPCLASGLLLLATALLKAAGLSLARCSAITSRLPQVAAAEAAGDAPAAQAALQQLAAAVAVAGAVEAGKQQTAAAAGKLALAGDDEALPSLAAAQAAYVAFKALQRAVAVEALAATASLRLQEGKPAEGAAPAAAPAAADGAAFDGGKKKDKKKEKSPQGMQLGKGTAQLRSYVEQAAAGSGDGSREDGGVEAQLALLSLSGGADVAAQLQRSLAGVAAALDPQEPQLAQQLAALRAVIEANQVGYGCLPPWVVHPGPFAARGAHPPTHPG
jgi:hypothetical protein